MADSSNDLVTLAAPKGVAACSVLGVEVKVVKGAVRVPASAVPELERHGFTLASPAEADA